MDKGCTVYVSELLPRKDGNQGLSDPVNDMLHNLVPEGNRISHPTITHAHLYDEVHLRRNINEGEKYSGAQLLAIDLYRAVYKTVPMDSRISRSLSGDRRSSSRNRLTGRGGR